MAMLSFLLCFSYCLLLSDNRSQSADNTPHSEGTYVLEFIIQTDAGTGFYPISVYGNPQWGHMLCNVDKEILIRGSGFSLEMHNAKLICAKYYGDEL